MTPSLSQILTKVGLDPADVVSVPSLLDTKDGNAIVSPYYKIQCTYTPKDDFYTPNPCQTNSLPPKLIDPAFSKEINLTLKSSNGRYTMEMSNSKYSHILRLSHGSFIYGALIFETSKPVTMEQWSIISPCVFMMMGGLRNVQLENELEELKNRNIALANHLDSFSLSCPGSSSCSFRLKNMPSPSNNTLLTQLNDESMSEVNKGFEILDKSMSSSSSSTPPSTECTVPLHDSHIVPPLSSPQQQQQQQEEGERKEEKEEERKKNQQNSHQLVDIASETTTTSTSATPTTTTNNEKDEDMDASFEKHCQLLFKNLPCAMWIANARGETIFVSNACGCARIDPVQLGMKWLALIHPEDRAAAESYLHCVCISHEPWTAEYRFYDANQGYRWLLGQAVRFEMSGVC